MDVAALLLIILLLVMRIYSHVLLYDTETNGVSEYNDCIYHNSKYGATIKYCLRPGSGQMISKTYTECTNDGKKWFYKDLLAYGISPKTVLKWSASVEVADDYARVFYTQTVAYSSTDFLCNCTHSRSFGRFCEYTLFHTDTIQNSIDLQFALKGDRRQNQRWAVIVCYQTLSCDFGLLCLDWRNICDGEQQCMDGLDEENCDKLEFNECELDEYRCSNGMCIPELYLLDGDLDCMDYSDEMSTRTIECSIFSAPFECDERVIRRENWSCGDGSSLFSLWRAPFQYVVTTRYDCFNYRNLNYICEMWSERAAWTLPNGMCELTPDYDDPRFDMTTANLSSTEKCVYLLKCALTKGFEHDCPCGQNTSCYELMISFCPDPQRIQFPTAGIFRPYLLTYYTAQPSYIDKAPTNVIFSGRTKCRGYRAEATLNANITVRNDHIKTYLTSFQKDSYFCVNSLIERNTSSLVRYFHKNCWNTSRTFSNFSYHFLDACSSTQQCISAYRINDGMGDCAAYQDEKNSFRSISSCARIQRDRFQCSFQQQTCFIPTILGDGKHRCDNQFDRYVYGTGVALDQIPCIHRSDDGCQFLKQYIQQSSIIQTENASMLQPKEYISHKVYCDTRWNFYPPIDEQSLFCREWTCPENMFQCKTGQCIPLEWVCDNEWDCNDASDEQGIFLDDNILENNPGLSGLHNRIQLCLKRYVTQPFSDICNISIELPCLLANVTNPLDIKNNRPCIDLRLIGDGVEHCYGGFDEQNVAVGCQGSMKGLDFHCKYTSTCIPKVLLCIDHCPNNEDASLCFYQSQTDICRGPSDAVCFDGRCIVNGRCNQKKECRHGEDEYWCPPFVYVLPYRHEKLIVIERMLHPIKWPIFPHPKTKVFLYSSESRASSDVNKISNAHSDVLSFAYVCNRGLAVRSDTGTRCLCPGAYYGDRCQYFSDRLTVLAHVNFSSTLYDHSNATDVVIKIIASLIFEDHQVIDRFEFHVRPVWEYTKQKFYLVYSRSGRFLKHKEQRYFNRTDIIDHHPYSVRFEAFELQTSRAIAFAAWDYPIYFDFLPAFRLATILRFPETYLNQSANPCLHVTCPTNSVCLPMFRSQTQSHYCSCKSGFYGPECQSIDLRCSAYCSNDSICRPNSQTLLSGNKQPFCICPLNRFGPRCNLEYGDCHPNPCENNGICYQTFDLSGVRPVFCECQKYFYGDRCELEKSPVQIEIVPFLSINDTLVSVIQYYDINNKTFKLVLRQQQLFAGIPTRVRFNSDQKQLPILAVLKLHQNLLNTSYYIVYIQPNTMTINITSLPQFCPHSSLLVAQDNIPTAFKYHQICRNDSDRLCFYDSTYLCVCENDQQHVACLGHNPTIDRCQSCLSGGKCVRGDLQESNDFVCICPQCHTGRLCEFSMQPFTFLLDSLLVFDKLRTQVVYVVVIFMLFTIGLFNNLCSFVTFKRTEPRKFAVGYCLFILAILNQFALLCLLLKFVHIFMGSISGVTSDISCKTINYLLAVSIRLTYWLLSLITIIRSMIVIFPTSETSRNLRTTVRSIIVIFTMLLAMHTHEILFSKSIRQPESKVSFCVIDFGQNSAVSSYNRISTLLHHVIPFLIQVISITLLIVSAARQRTKVVKTKYTYREVLRKQFTTHRELYLTPSIIILSTLPEAILSFGLTCKQLNNWQRHVLLVAYLLSYVPQVLGFLLCVIPSTAYKNEFSKTMLGKNFFRCIKNVHSHA